MSGRLNGKIAVVTGAASGIGLGIAEAFSRERATVVMADLVSSEHAADAIRAVGAVGTAPMYVQTDVADEDAVRKLAEVVFAEHSHVDVLVNNAGIFRECAVENMTVDVWDQTIAVNLRSVFLCTRAFLPSMLERGSGRIIATASQLGQIGGVDAAHYAASKAGIIGFTKSLAREVSARGVLVNAIAPGAIETPLLEGESEAWRSAKLAELPMARFGRVDEVTPTAVLLASDDGSYYTGQTLGPNGGDVML